MFCHIVSGRCVDCLNDDHCDVGLRCRSDNTCGVGSSIDCPPHAHAEGDLCVCDSGYEQEGDTCVPVTEPDPEPDPDPTPSPAPSAWICDPDLYDSGGWFSECDCGCGAYDPDCYGHALGNCERKHCPAGERVVVDDNALCEPLPEVPVGWTCDPAWYLDGACDCGCGADDGDCPDGYTAAACVYDACPGWQGATQDDPTICWDWQCDYDLYDEGWFTELCHCGCGVWDDEDCSFERSADVCDVNMCPEGQVPAAENNAYCVDAPQ